MSAATIEELSICLELVRRRSPAAGRDGITPDGYAADRQTHLPRLSEALAAGTWRPSPLLRRYQRKPDGRRRILAVPTVEDRVVIELIRARLGDRIERRLSDAAFAYRPRRSPRDAVAAVRRAIAGGASHVALADIWEFFDSIPLRPLLAQVAALRPDPWLLALLERLLLGHATRRECGVAQGSALSPMRSNLTEVPAERAIAAAGFELARYADNLCVPCPGAARAAEALALKRRQARQHGLRLKEAASGVASVAEGFDWLGFRLGQGGARVSLTALEALRARVDLAAAGLPPGEPLAHRLEPIVRGWLQYFDVPLPEGADLGPNGPAILTLMRALAPPALGPEDAASQDAPADAADDVPLPEWDDGPADVSPPEPNADPRATLLDRADRLATHGDFAGAEAAWREAEEAATRPHTHAPDPVPEPLWSDEALDAVMGIFLAGQDAFERAAVQPSAPRRFQPVDGPPARADVEAHLAGRAALAVRPRLPDGTCLVGVIDVDASDPEGRMSAAAYADAVARIATERGLTVLVEDTGGRGAHVWLPLEEPAPADAVAHCLDGLMASAGRPADGVTLERLPGRDDEPDLHGQSMAIPLGVHPETGRRSGLRWGHGPAVADDLTNISGVPLNPPERLGPGPQEVPIAPLELWRGPAGSLPDWSSFGAAVAQVMGGCAVLRHLAEKAAAVGHLDHAERLSLLYSLGHLGPAGRRALHAIVGKCRNYDVAETERQVERMSGLPIGCARLAQKHGEAGGVVCACPFDDVRRRGGYPTPLLHAGGFRRVWREELRRRDAVVARAHPSAGITATEVEEPLPPPAPNTPAPAGPPAPAAAAHRHGAGPTGIEVPGLPPHEWAAPAPHPGGVR